MFSRNKQPAIKSLIAQGTRIEGDVHFVDGLRIDGEVRGDVRAQGGQSGLLVISALARVDGAVHAAHVIVNGEVVVADGALVKCDIRARRVIVRGAVRARHGTA